MIDLTQEQLQDFSDKVADICEEMQFNPDQMLEAMGSYRYVYWCRYEFWEIKF